MLPHHTLRLCFYIWFSSVALHSMCVLTISAIYSHSHSFAYLHPGQGRRRHCTQQPPQQPPGLGAADASRLGGAAPVLVARCRLRIGRGCERLVVTAAQRYQVSCCFFCRSEFIFVRVFLYCTTSWFVDSATPLEYSCLCPHAVVLCVFAP